MKNSICLAVAALLLLSAYSCQNERGKNYTYSTKVDRDGLMFIKAGLEGGLAEIKASGVAVTNSTNTRVINFAKMMISDHTKACAELTKIEGEKGLVGPDTINTKHHELIDSLSKETGPAFDKDYMTMMVADHESAVELFRMGSQNTDTKISDFATATLKTIRVHLDSAKNILASLK